MNGKREKEIETQSEEIERRKRIQRKSLFVKTKQRTVHNGGNSSSDCMVAIMKTMQIESLVFIFIQPENNLH